MGEHARIARYFAPLAAAEPGSFALTDDAAILTPPPGFALVITSDSVIAGTHVLTSATPEHFAQKLMRRNLSDLAAMGATPWRYTLNLHTPSGLNEGWFADFAAALAREQAHFGLVLVGGDSTSGAPPLHTTLTCFGLLAGRPLRRHGAQPGDDLYVSGTLGGAAYALHLLQQNQPVDAALAARYHCPEPRLALGQALRMQATGGIDISDGLLADIAQLCAVSGVGARLTRAAIPCHLALTQAIAADEAAWRFALSGGDDYELCFTAAPVQRAALATLSAQLDLPLTRIGEITRNTQIALVDEAGAALPFHATGWEYD